MLGQTMWRPVLNRLGIMAHPALERRWVDSKKCDGIITHETVQPGELLALVPFWACASPTVAQFSPWGKQLLERIDQDVVATEGNSQIVFPRDSAVTTGFLALCAHDPHNPLFAYLSHVSLQMASDEELAGQLSEDEHEKLLRIRSINKSIVAQLHERLRPVVPELSMEETQRAFTMCESRCVDVPFGESILGGAALVPFVDLLNHDTSTQGVSVCLMGCPDIRRECSVKQWCEDVNSSKTPFYVVVRALEQIDAGGELTYAYADPEADSELYTDRVFWASRFRFLPTTR